MGGNWKVGTCRNVDRESEVQVESTYPCSVYTDYSIGVIGTCVHVLSTGTAYRVVLVRGSPGPARLLITYHLSIDQAVFRFVSRRPLGGRRRPPDAGGRGP